MTKKKRRSFTAEFKADAVRLCATGERSVAQVAVDLGLTESALRSWVKKDETDAAFRGTEPVNDLRHPQGKITG